jgi:pimeloyl-ACP methyl ester carboxylesterase
MSAEIIPSERAVTFGSCGTLVGVRTDPVTGSTHRGGLVVLNAGVLSRIGPGRLHVKLTRHASRAGFYALRFDLSGLGDSPPRRDGLPIEEYAPLEAAEAMDYLTRFAGCDEIFLLGLCSGAEIALEAARRDTRVKGVVAVNATGLATALLSSTDDAARKASQDFVHDAAARTTLRLYGRRLFSLTSWSRFLSGRSDYTAVRGALKTLAKRARHAVARRPEAASPLADLASSLARRGTRVLLVFSEGSTAWDTAHAGRERRAIEHVHPAVEVLRVRNTDHVFTSLESQERLAHAVSAWLAQAPDATIRERAGTPMPSKNV